eukprot:m.263061 g.263061  ORF g.263061 m.263061 type:complete len:244 (-) comp48385_c0_seq1:111-842(-)
MDRGMDAKPKHVIVLMGPPGAGKGSQAPPIVDILQIPHLSTGDLLRAAVAAGSEIGVLAKKLMEQGQLVPDEVVFKAIRKRLQQTDCSGGFLLDGFPRTLHQAKALDLLLRQLWNTSVTSVFFIQASERALEERICGRWVHPASGRSYHSSFRPPKSMKRTHAGNIMEESMRDDTTGDPLVQRADDTVDAFKQRLACYNTETLPLLKHYVNAGVVEIINGDLKPEKVARDIAKSLFTTLRSRL